MFANEEREKLLSTHPDLPMGVVTRMVSAKQFSLCEMVNRTPALWDHCFEQDSSLEKRFVNLVRSPNCSALLVSAISCGFILILNEIFQMVEKWKSLDAESKMPYFEAARSPMLKAKKVRTCILDLYLLGIHGGAVGVGAGWRADTFPSSCWDFSPRPVKPFIAPLSVTGVADRRLLAITCHCYEPDAPLNCFCFHDIWQKQNAWRIPVEIDYHRSLLFLPSFSGVLIELHTRFYRSLG